MELHLETQCCCLQALMWQFKCHWWSISESDIVISCFITCLALMSYDLCQIVHSPLCILRSLSLCQIIFALRIPAFSSPWRFICESEPTWYPGFCPCSSLSDLVCLFWSDSVPDCLLPEVKNVSRGFQAYFKTSFHVMSLSRLILAYQSSRQFS